MENGTTWSRSHASGSADLEVVARTWVLGDRYAGAEPLLDGVDTAEVIVVHLIVVPNSDRPVSPHYLHAISLQSLNIICSLRYIE
jgi:hypothetical protein